MELEAMTWEPPTPQTPDRPSVWAALPEDFAALGSPVRPEHLFTRLQHPWTWQAGRPTLGRTTRTWLETHFDTFLPEIEERHPSEDGATKLVLALQDGHRIETVHMPRAVRSPRVTLCLSSQVGCAMGCAFCATGTMGIQRNLSAGEIVGQVLAALHALGPERPSQVTLVFMGMGEPLHNLEAVHRAIRVFNHLQGLNISTRRITVSTSGLVPGLERLARLEPRPWLAVSLNATTDETRNALMPVNRTWNLERLREALAAWPLAEREKLTIEYVLMADINDRDEDAERLAAWMGGLRHAHNLNLIPMNAHAGSPFREPDPDRIQRFVDVLRARGCFVTLRKSRGRDVQGACGQLIKPLSPPPSEP